MAKRLTEEQKEEITKLFIEGININDLSEKFYCTELTISRNLKKTLGLSKFKELNIKNKNETNSNTENNDNKIENFLEQPEFIEIAPLNCDIENTLQKDFSSVSISDIEFPKTVFMIVDKKVELEIKYLKDYPKWQFLSQEELKRKTIEIYYDLKIAKSFCGKEQKVIKVPNTSVFKIVAPLLLSRGISRIVSSDKLISL